MLFVLVCFYVKGAEAFTSSAVTPNYDHPANETRRSLTALVDALRTTFQMLTEVQLECSRSRYTTPTTLAETRSRILAPKDCGFCA